MYQKAKRIISQRASTFVMGIADIIVSVANIKNTYSTLKERKWTVSFYCRDPVNSDLSWTLQKIGQYAS